MGRLERRIAKQKANEKAKMRAKEWSGGKWWKALDMGRYIDEPHKINGKVVEGCPTCRERYKWGRHTRMERCHEKADAINYEKNAEEM